MRLAFCGVIAALSVVVLFLTGIVPVATIALPAVAGCLLIAVVAETNVRYGFAVYLVSSLFSALLTPDREAALLIEEKDLTGETLTEAVKKLTADPETLEKYGKNARKLAIIDSNRLIYQEILKLAAEKDR